MCDCYEHKCDNPNCDTFMPIHIGDFITSRDNIRVYCTRHIPKDFKGYVWKYSRREDDIPKGFKVGIELLDISELPTLYRDNPSSWLHPNSCSCDLVNNSQH